MEERAVVEFINKDTGEIKEIEVPLDITANDLTIALNEAFSLDMDIDNIFNCYLIAENPIALLRGNKKLLDFGIHDGTTIINARG